MENKQIEEQILIHAIHSPYFARNVLSMNPTVLIKTSLNNEIAKSIIRHYATSDSLLTKEALNVEMERRLKVKAQQHGQQISQAQLDTVFVIDKMLVDAQEDNSDSTLNAVEKYIHTELGNAVILEEATKGSDGISERVAKRLDKVNSIKIMGTKYEPLDVMHDIDNRMHIYSEFGKRKIASGLAPLDMVTNGGLELGQIGLLGAPQGTGKTTALTNLSYYYAKKGHHNVLHISLEELEADQLLRFDRLLTDSSAKDVFDDHGKIRQSYLDKLKNYYSQDHDGGNIYFVKSTPRTMTVDDIGQLITREEREHNCKIDVVILDYADLLSKQGLPDSEAQAGDILFQNLVKVAQEKEVIIFTATQLNRGSFQTETLTMSNIEGSYRKKNTIAFGATLNSKGEERNQGRIRWYLDKIRNNYAKDNDQFLYLKYDLKTMKLLPESPSEVEEHKNLVGQDIAHKPNEKAKIGKDQNLNDIINQAIGS